MNHPKGIKLNKKRLLRMRVVGALIAVYVGLAFILWMVLSSMGIIAFPRLVSMLCLPPALMSTLAGVYMLVIPDKDGSGGD